MNKQVWSNNYIPNNQQEKETKKRKRVLEQSYFAIESCNYIVFKGWFVFVGVKFGMIFSQAEQPPKDHIIVSTFFIGSTSTQRFKNSLLKYVFHFDLDWTINANWTREMSLAMQQNNNFEVELFDGKNNLSLWQSTIKDVLV